MRGLARPAAREQSGAVEARRSVRAGNAGGSPALRGVNSRKAMAASRSNACEADPHWLTRRLRDEAARHSACRRHAHHPQPRPSVALPQRTANPAIRFKSRQGQTAISGLRRGKPRSTRLAESRRRERSRSSSCRHPGTGCLVPRPVPLESRPAPMPICSSRSAGLSSRKDCNGILIHLLHRLNLDDPAIPIAIPGIRWLPFYYCFDFRANDLGYRLITEDSLVTFFPDDDPNVADREEWPDEDYPLEFPNPASRSRLTTTIPRTWKTPICGPASSESGNSRKRIRPLRKNVSLRRWTDWASEFRRRKRSFKRHCQVRLCKASQTAAA